MLSTDCYVKVLSRLSSIAAANYSMMPIRLSNSWKTNRPASLVSGEEETSTSTGREGKKLNDKPATDCKLMGDLRADVQVALSQQLIRALRSLLLAHLK
jgi:hypothetical protein